MNRICRTCCRNIKPDRRFYSLDEEHDPRTEKIKLQLESCVPQMTLNVIQNPVICDYCVNTLDRAYSFKSMCLRTEEMIYDYLVRTDAANQCVDISLIFNGNNQDDLYLEESLNESFEIKSEVFDGEFEKKYSLSTSFHNYYEKGNATTSTTINNTESFSNENIESSNIENMECSNTENIECTNAECSNGKNIENPTECSNLEFTNRKNLENAAEENISQKSTIDKNVVNCQSIENIYINEISSDSVVVQQNSLVIQDPLADGTEFYEFDESQLNSTKTPVKHPPMLEKLGATENGKSLDSPYKNHSWTYNNGKRQLVHIRQCSVVLTCLADVFHKSLKHTFKKQTEAENKKGKSDVIVAANSSVSIPKCSTVLTCVTDVTVKSTRCNSMQEISRSNLNGSRLGKRKSRRYHSCNLTSNQSDERVVLRRSLRKYQKTSTKDKQFKCKECRYCSKSKSNLDLHMKTCTIKCFACDYCDYQTDVNSNLYHHMFIHDKSRPFKCNHCKYKTTLKSNLIRHRLIHTGKKPYKCLSCDFTSAWKQSLQTHVNTQH